MPELNRYDLSIRRGRERGKEENKERRKGGADEEKKL